MAVIENTVKGDSGQDITIYIEVDEHSVARDPYRNTRGVSEGVKAAFESSMELIHTSAEKIAETVHTIPEKVRPRGFEVQFAIKIDAELGAVIAKSSTEAQLQVTLRWGEKD